MSAAIHLVRVFADGANGGNPAPIVVDAAAMSDDDMRAVARDSGHESGFVLPPPDGSGCDIALRFWVPNHEMEMCGHATVGAVWLLDRLGRLPRERVAIATASGIVEARVSCLDGETSVEISQPVGRVEALDADARRAIAAVLRIATEDLLPLPVQNAATSRVKTLVPLRSVAILDGLQPDFDRVQTLCEAIGSTGLYPYAVSGTGRFDARQFPKSSGYPEDPATGIAAAALAFGVLATGLAKPDVADLRVRQGRAMGRPSQISVRFERVGDVVSRCWVGGPVCLDPQDAPDDMQARAHHVRQGGRFPSCTGGRVAGTVSVASAPANDAS